MEKLLQEGGAILSYLLREIPLPTHDVAENWMVTRDIWKVKANPISQFINDCTVETPDKWVSTSDLYRAYTRWCKSKDRDTPLTSRTVMETIRKMGWGSTQISELGNKKYVIENMELKPEIAAEIAKIKWEEYNKPREPKIQSAAELAADIDATIAQAKKSKPIASAGHSDAEIDAILSHNQGLDFE
jgi:phage/plasmid-associated DNA primase